MNIKNVDTLRFFVSVDMFYTCMCAIAYCTMHGGLGMQKLAQNVSDGYDIW